MSPITTHVLDIAAGKPAENISVMLEFADTPHSWKQIGTGLTNKDGRITAILPDSYKLAPGNYRLYFELKKYFSTHNRRSFYPFATVTFEVENTAEHYHIPLLLSNYGYSTYRGS